VGILDTALFRRFDDLIKYELPDQERIVATLKAKLGSFKSRVLWAQLARLAQGLSFADITRACEEAIKDSLIHGHTHVTQAQIVDALRDRKIAVTHKNSKKKRNN
jgi:SpoVK/Ycf46/Vps4 family AAA+-type ATPase